MTSHYLSRRDLLVQGGIKGAGLAAGSPLLGAALVDAAPALPAANPVTISVREHQQLRLKLLRAEIPHFEAAMAARGMPIKVNLQAGPTPDNDFQTQLTVDYAAGAGPDVTSFPVSWTPDYILANFLKDITAYVKDWPDWMRYWYPTMRDAAQVYGHIYFLPREAAVYSLFYRKDILSAHHIPTTQPRTWDDLLVVAREIKRKTGKFALNFPAGVQWGAGTFDEGFIHLMLGSGSPIYDTSTRRWVVKSPGLRRVFAFYATAAREGLLPVRWLNSPNPWQPTKYTAFPRGDLVMTTSGTWSWEFDWGAGGAAPIPDIFHKVATWQFPSIDGKPFTTAGVGWAWAIAGRGTHAAAAWEFVKFMSSGRALADNLIAIGAVAPRGDIAGSQPEYGKLPFLVAAERTLNSSRSFIPKPGEARIQQFIAEATQSLIDGKATPDQAMNTFAANVTQALGPDLVETM
ncbi:MAG TPA: extracellular solute-binding protein [Chloroflexota bacterium]|nr:extracellular solute-binding protein [Chloroflexota bacterium]